MTVHNNEKDTPLHEAASAGKEGHYSRYIFNLSKHCTAIMLFYCYYLEFGNQYSRISTAVKFYFGAHRLSSRKCLFLLTSIFLRNNYLWNSKTEQLYFSVKNEK